MNQTEVSGNERNEENKSRTRRRSGQRLTNLNSPATMLRQIVKNQIVNDILRPSNLNQHLGHRKHSILVVDKPAMKVISSCMRLEDVYNESITLVEDITMNREPIPSLEAIYILFPTAHSVNLLISDFTPKSHLKSKALPAKGLYKSARVYFLDPLEPELFNLLAKSPALKFFTALVELNLSFTPIESQVFTICHMDIHRAAAGIVGLCSSLNVWPNLSAEICYRVDQKLAELQKHQPDLSLDSDAQLIILDRSFDLITPLLHETTLQAMTVDLLNFKDGIYTYRNDNGHFKETILDESDPLWVELRHKHIAQVLQRVSEVTRESRKATKTETSTIRELGDTIRQMPASQKLVSKLSAYINLSDECRKKFFDSLEKIILLEQDMATGYTPDGEKLKDNQAISRLSTLIMPAIPPQVRLRLILIFMLSIGKHKGEDYFERLLHHTNIPQEDYGIVRKMLRWRNQTIITHPRPLCEEERYPSSRWEPRIREIIRETIDRKLDPKEFRMVGKRPEIKPEQRSASSARYGRAFSGQSSAQRKIIFYIIGGMTYSEMRCVYELSAATNTSIFIGSDVVWTPSEFLESLRC